MTESKENRVPIRNYPKNNARLNGLKKFFHLCYAESPDFIIRVPGRVNLIGEHIDYCGYGVCPMALQQDILIAVSKNDSGKISLINRDDKYEKQQLEPLFNGCTQPEWHHYFLCGVKGVRDSFPDGELRIGMNIAVDGNIPPSAGLSSSSALVSGASLGSFYINGHVPIKDKIAELCASAERYIGTQGGGMDQAIAFLATEGCAKFIEFNPLRSCDVKLPDGSIFVIAHSLVEKNKAASNDFNQRVVECRLAAQLIAKATNLEWRKIKKLGDVQAYLNKSLTEMISLTEKVLHVENYKKSEIMDILGVSQTEIEEISFTENTKSLEEFKLQQRALHVFQEAERVRQFKAVCEGKSGEEALTALGRLMYESHESLRDLYEASHPQLDKIVEISRGLTYGCRLTGAGWGGCTVALVSSDKVDDYIHALKKEYYDGLNVNEEKLKSLVFSTGPHSGACIYQ